MTLKHGKKTATWIGRDLSHQCFRDTTKYTLYWWNIRQCCFFEGAETLHRIFWLRTCLLLNRIDKSYYIKVQSMYHMLFVYLQFPSITFLSMIVTTYNLQRWIGQTIQFLPEDLWLLRGASQWLHMELARCNKLSWALRCHQIGDLKHRVIGPEERSPHG